MSETTNVIREVEGRMQLHLRRLRLSVVGGPDTGLTAQLENDVVRIIPGPFADFHGTISEIKVDQGKLKGLVNNFDPGEPVEVGLRQGVKG